MVDADLALPAPRTTGARHSLRRWGTALALGVYAYPVLFVASLHVTWFAAWAALGHAPRPNLDDPKSVVIPSRTNPST